MQTVWSWWWECRVLGWEWILGKPSMWFSRCRSSCQKRNKCICETSGTFPPRWPRRHHKLWHTSERTLPKATYEAKNRGHQDPILNSNTQDEFKSRASTTSHATCDDDEREWWPTIAKTSWTEAGPGVAAMWGLVRWSQEGGLSPDRRDLGATEEQDEGSIGWSPNLHFCREWKFLQ